MNQHQRKFLLEAIEQQYKQEKSKLNDRKPQEPSMNNYLIAAILDGSFKMKDESLIKKDIKERVRNLGKGEGLIQSHGRHYGSRYETENNVVSLPATLLFEAPEGYQRELDAYKKNLAAWQAEFEALESSIAAMRIKVQIGSDKALEVLVDQADKLCSMSLTQSNKLLLGNQ